MKRIIVITFFTLFSLASYAGKGSSGFNDFYVSRLSCALAKDLPDNSSAYRCADNTITMSLELDNSKFVYEGLCGPVAAANVMYPMCNKVFSPTEASRLGYFDDITPGTRMSTLADGLNRIFRENSRHCPTRGQWKTYQSDSGYSFLNSALANMRSRRSKYGKTPFIAIIKSLGSSSLHYVSVVDIFFVKENWKPRVRKMVIPSNTDSHRKRKRSSRAQREREPRNNTQFSRITNSNINKCRVKYNDGKHQKIYTCRNFLKLMRMANDSYGMNLYLKEYNYLLFR